MDEMVVSGKVVNLYNRALSLMKNLDAFHIQLGEDSPISGRVGSMCSIAHWLVADADRLLVDLEKERRDRYENA